MSKWFLALINSISLMLIIILTSVELPTFNYAFYSFQYNKNKTYDIVGISPYDLENVTLKLMNYMKGKESDLDIFVSINGQTREFFNNIEKSHMADVKNLFQIGYSVRTILIIIFFITFLAAFVYKKRPALKEYATSFLIYSFILILLGSVFTLSALNNFDKYFTIFHEMFFNNDLWILDPAKDLLINIVPTAFFIDIFKLIISLYLIISCIIGIVCVAYIKYANTKQEVRAS